MITPPLPRTRRRFIAKESRLGRRTVFGVYDVERGSWPGIISGAGRVQQDHATEAAAEAEAQRCEETAR